MSSQGLADGEIAAQPIDDNQDKSIATKEERPETQSAMGGMFDHGVFYRAFDAIGWRHDQDTFRNFIDEKHRDWDASRLRAHHFDVEKLLKWALYGPDKKANDMTATNKEMSDKEGPTNEATNEVTNEATDLDVYAMFTSTEGRTATFPMDDEGTLRVFLQRVVNRCRDHTNVRIDFFNDEDVAMTAVDQPGYCDISYLMEKMAELNPSWLAITPPEVIYALPPLHRVITDIELIAQQERRP
jgi:hypothetical protein